MLDHIPVLQCLYETTSTILICWVDWYIIGAAQYVTDFFFCLELQAGLAVPNNGMSRHVFDTYACRQGKFSVFFSDGVLERIWIF